MCGLSHGAVEVRTLARRLRARTCWRSRRGRLSCRPLRRDSPSVKSAQALPRLQAHAQRTRSFIISLVVRQTLHMRTRLGEYFGSSMAALSRVGWREGMCGRAVAVAESEWPLSRQRNCLWLSVQGTLVERLKLPHIGVFDTEHHMASSSDIPNLKTLLGQRRGGGLRGRGRGRGGLGGSSEETEQIRDNAIKATDQDAAGSRASCVELGYLHDPYAKLFATQSVTRRLPLLNRGRFSALLKS